MVLPAQFAGAVFRILESCEHFSGKLRQKIKRINKDMKLILYSPGIWVIHSRRTYSQYDRNAKQTNDNL